MNDRTLKRNRIQQVQVNMGKLCNQSCSHCHVDAGPHKTRENMDATTAQRLLLVLENSADVRSVDITGGAPELNPNFRNVVRELRSRGLEVIDRCNLTVLFENGQEDLASFLADHKVVITASLPCYTEATVNQQRGEQVFEKSIEALKILCALGYGEDPTLKLNLVYNPNGPFLPPDQNILEAKYKTELFESYGIRFNQLYTMTNMPIKRFKYDLKKSGQLESYEQLLRSAENQSAWDFVMCKSLVSVSWDGKVFDCDFNQMLDLTLGSDIWSIQSFSKYSEAAIVVGDHCFACVAGHGSSCSGSKLARNEI